MPRLYPRIVASIAFSFLLIFQAACSRTPPNPLANAMKSFSGKWKVVSLDRNGTKSDAEALKEMSVSVEGDKFKFTELTGPTERKGDVSVRFALNEEYIIQVDPAKSGEVDFVHTSGEHEGKTRQGLFELNGDSLKICLVPVGTARPERIASGQGLTNFVLERQP